MRTPIRFLLPLSLIAVASMLVSYRTTPPDLARLLPAIHAHLRATNVLTLRGPDGPTGEVIDSRFLYQSVAAFVAANPDCCELVTRDRQNMTLGVWPRLSGRAVSWIKVSYRPTDRAGVPIPHAANEVRWLETSWKGEIDDRRLW